MLFKGTISTSAEEEKWSSLLEIMEAIVDQSPPTLLPSESFSYELYLHSSPHVCKRTQTKLCKGTNGTFFLEEIRRQLLASYFIDAWSLVATLKNLSASNSMESELKYTLACDGTLERR
ncbi:unnamed protein product [Brassica oleracea var. botrytis]